jgi:hypothetical protein
MSETSPSAETARIKYRKLRIAVSAVCGILCLLLIALWVRSYWVIEGIGRSGRTPVERTVFVAMSDNGTLAFVRWTVPLRSDRFAGLTDEWSYQRGRPQGATERRFFWKWNSEVFYVRFPTWLAAIVLCGFTVVPWTKLKRRFRLRTMLIAMTLVAALLAVLILATI